MTKSVRMVDGADGGHRWQNVMKNDRVCRDTSACSSSSSLSHWCFPAAWASEGTLQWCVSAYSKTCVIWNRLNKETKQEDSCDRKELHRLLMWVSSIHSYLVHILHNVFPKLTEDVPSTLHPFSPVGWFSLKPHLSLILLLWFSPMGIYKCCKNTVHGPTDFKAKHENSFSHILSFQLLKARQMLGCHASH